MFAFDEYRPIKNMFPNKTYIAFLGFLKFANHCLMFFMV